MPVPANYWQLRRRSRLCSCYTSSAGTTSTTAGTPSDFKFLPLFWPIFYPSFLPSFSEKNHTRPPRGGRVPLPATLQFQSFTHLFNPFFHPFFKLGLKELSRLTQSCHTSSAGTTSTTARTSHFWHISLLSSSNLDSKTSQVLPHTPPRGRRVPLPAPPLIPFFHPFLTQIFTYFSDQNLTRPLRGRRVPLPATLLFQFF